MKRNSFIKALCLCLSISTLSGCSFAKNTDESAKKVEDSSAKETTVTEMSGNLEDSAVTDASEDEKIDLATAQQEFAKNPKDIKSYIKVRKAISQEKEELLSSDKDDDTKISELNVLNQKEYIDQISLLYGIPADELDISMFWNSSQGVFYDPRMEGGLGDGEIETNTITAEDGTICEWVNDEEIYDIYPVDIVDAVNKYRMNILLLEAEKRGTAPDGIRPKGMDVIYPNANINLPTNDVKSLGDDLIPGYNLISCNGSKAIVLSRESFYGDTKTITINGQEVTVYNYNDTIDENSPVYNLKLRDMDVWELWEEDIVRLYDKPYPFNTGLLRMWMYDENAFEILGLDPESPIKVSMFSDNRQEYLNNVHQYLAETFHEYGYSWDELTYQNYRDTMAKYYAKQKRDYQELVQRSRAEFKKAMEQFAISSSLIENMDFDDNNDSSESAAATEVTQVEEAQPESKVITDGDSWNQIIVGDIVPIAGKVPATCYTHISNGHILAQLYDENYGIVSSADLTPYGMDHTNYKYVYFTMVANIGNGTATWQIAGTDDASMSGNLGYHGQGTIETEQGESTIEQYDGN